MDEYIIKGSTLTGIGNAIRRKTGGTSLIDPENMESEIDAISGGGEQATPEIAVDENGLITATAGDKSATKQLSAQSGKTITPGPTEQIAVAAGKYVTGDVIVEAVENTGGGGSANVVVVPMNIAAEVSVTAEKVYTHALYNGVRLLKVPESELTNYPYLMIVQYQDGSYHLYAGQKPAIYINLAAIPAQSCSYDYDGSKWVYYSVYTSTKNLGSHIKWVWSNFDICDSGGTTVYYEGTDPVPTD